MYEAVLVAQGDIVLAYETVLVVAQGGVRPGSELGAWVVVVAHGPFGRRGGR